ncbi:MAG TPA: patatin-like phospholipase family protein, partial [Pyrinomonadaceae bacterium]|nr:patatin-like phospholipase family protein [Pyrinomonadaceae bacterium]
VAGTSAGALVGGAYAAGMSIEELEELGRSLRWRHLGRMTLSRLGIQSNARMEEYIRERFPVTRFEELSIPFAAVATDLRTGAPVVMRDAGDVAFAIRASCALPGWYIPVVDGEGRQLIDGGLVANIPSAAARALGADVVVAVDVNHEGAKFLGVPTSIVGVLLQSIILMQRTAAKHQRHSADLVISPSVGHIRWDEMARGDELLAAGEDAARAALPVLKELLEPQPQERVKWFQLRRNRDKKTA